MKVGIKLGRKIKFFRLMRGLTQIQLGEKTGISYQQIQKYEDGSNQVLVSRIFELAEALSIDVTSFFTDVDVEPKETESENMLKLAKEYSQIKSKKSRDFVYSVVKFLSQLYSF